MLEVAALVDDAAPVVFRSIAFEGTSAMSSRRRRPPGPRRRPPFSIHLRPRRRSTPTRSRHRARRSSSSASRPPAKPPGRLPQDSPRGPRTLRPSLARARARARRRRPSSSAPFCRDAAPIVCRSTWGTAKGAAIASLHASVSATRRDVENRYRHRAINVGVGDAVSKLSLATNDCGSKLTEQGTVHKWTL